MKDLKSKGRAAAGALASLTMIASMSAVPALAVAPGDGADGNAAADPQAEVGENAAVAGAVKVAEPRASSPTTRGRHTQRDDPHDVPEGCARGAALVLRLLRRTRSTGN
ncbi:MAG: hypothetical protein ACLUW6_01565 [Coriobacteriaceae bacterium]